MLQTRTRLEALGHTKVNEALGHTKVNQEGERNQCVCSSPRAPHCEHLPEAEGQCHDCEAELAQGDEQTMIAIQIMKKKVLQTNNNKQAIADNNQFQVAGDQQNGEKKQ